MIFDDEGKRRFLEGARVVPDSLLTLWTARIQDEPTDPAIRGLTDRVIVDFCYRQLLGLPHSQVTLDWLADSLERLRMHEPVDEVFPLPKRARHRPGSDSLAFQVAWWVHLATSRGYSTTEAKEQAAEVFHKDSKSIGRYVKALAQADCVWAPTMNQATEWESYFIGEGKPLPKVKDKTSRVPVPTRRR